jgi:TonB family protein
MGSFRKLAVIIAGAATLAAGAPAGAQVTNPDWLRKPSPEDINAVFPVAGVKAGAHGKVTIACEVSVLGVLENCTVVSETPPGLGFGGAALMLAKSFLMKPATRDGKPVRAAVRIPIDFGPLPFGPVEKGDVMQMLPHPVWDSAPTRQMVLAAWPKGADKNKALGLAVLRCRVNAKAQPYDCQVAQENPDHEGFGRAALGLVGAFRLRVKAGDEQTVSKYWVTIPFRFVRPGSAEAEVLAVNHPYWTTGLSPDAVEAVYPPAAKAAHVRTGRGVVDCAVAASGRLEDCHVVAEEPGDLGFGSAAVQVATLMEMNPWTEDGAPVDGGRIRLPIRLTLPDEPAPESPPAPKL